MKLRAIAALALLGAAACAEDAPIAGGEGRGGAGGAGTSASKGATSSMEATSSSSSSSSGTSVELGIINPPPGMAFERRSVDVEVTFSAPSGSTIVLEQDGTMIASRSVGPEKAGIAGLRVPLKRGVTPFTVTLLSPEGQKTATVDGQLYGGRPVAVVLDTMVALHDGSVLQWGGGSPSLHPREAPALVTSIASGNGSVLLLDSAGHVHLAPGKSGAFTPIAGLDDIVAVAPGAGHTLFLRADGKLFGTGVNDRGQLGIGDTKNPTDVVAIPALDGIVAVAASDNASFAVREDGHLYAWGSNDDGQLGRGDEDTSPHPEPLIVTNLPAIKDVAAGRSHVLALTVEGKVFAWGQGSSGQLGDGSSGILASKSQPVPIELQSRALAVAARSNTSYARLLDGALFGWGQNSLAQLGVGDTNPRTRPSPCLVGAVRAFGPGATSALSLDTAANLRVWGSNASGQLGLPLPPDGPERSSAPVTVMWP